MKRHKIYIALAGIGVFLVTGAASCNGGGGAVKGDAAEANSQLNQYRQTQPPPFFTKSQLRQTAIEIETAQAQGAPTTTFFFNLGANDPFMSCPSIGFPISATDQITNPQQLARTGGRYNVDGVIDQIDPNGVYTGTTSQGTYVMCLNKSGQLYAAYWEGNVYCATGSVSWDYTKHQATDLTNPTGNFTQLNPKDTKPTASPSTTNP